MVMPRRPQVDNLFTASRQYPQNPLAVGFDLLTWPFQLANQVLGTPAVPVPNLSRFKAFSFGRLGGATLAPTPSVGPVPVAVPRPVPTLPGAAPAPAPALALPAPGLTQSQVSDWVATAFGEVGTVTEVAQAGAAGDHYFRVVNASWEPQYAAFAGDVFYRVTATDGQDLGWWQARDLRSTPAPAGGASIGPAPAAERPPIPPNTFGQQMVLVYQPDENVWSYITAAQATFVQGQGTRWEFHGLVNPTLAEADLQRLVDLQQLIDAGGQMVLLAAHFDVTPQEAMQTGYGAIEPNGIAAAVNAKRLGWDILDQDFQPWLARNVSIFPHTYAQQVAGGFLTPNSVQAVQRQMQEQGSQAARDQVAIANKYESSVSYLLSLAAQMGVTAGG